MPPSWFATSTLLTSCAGHSSLRYAHDRAGRIIPWDIIRQDLLATQPYEVLGLRAMLAVTYFEKVGGA